MDTPNSRLREARIRAGFKTAREAWERFGWNPNTYRAHEAGPKEYGRKLAFSYASAFNVSPIWLLTGLHEERTGETKNETDHTSAREVPIIPLGAIEAMLSRNKYELHAARTGTILGDKNLSELAQGHILDDDSMDDGTARALLRGDTVTLAPLDDDADPTPGSMVGVVVRGDKKLSVRRYVEGPMGVEGKRKVTLAALNKAWADRTVERDDVLLLLPVVKMERKLF